MKGASNWPPQEKLPSKSPALLELKPWCKKLYNSNPLRINGLLALNTDARLITQCNEWKIRVQGSYDLQYSQGTVLVELWEHCPHNWT